MGTKAKVVRAVDEFVTSLDPPIRTIFQWLRGLVRDTDPELREAINPWGVPCFLGKEGVIWMGTQWHYVQFGFFQGAVLKDPQGLLEGTGKRLRHVKVRGVDKAQEPALRALLQEAVALDTGKR